MFSSLRKQSKQGSGLGCLVFLAIPFACVGLGALGLTFWVLAQSATMLSWDEVPAHILSVDYQVNRDSDGSSYRTRASYEYEYRGNRHVGSRVSLHEHADNVGRFQENAYRELEAYRRSGQPFRCFVDPDNPVEAILYRSPRWEMVGFYAVFALLFGGFGIGMILFGVYGRNKHKQQVQMKEQFPDEPWRHNPDWDSGRIRSSSRGGAVMACVFAFFWNLISWPIVYPLYEEVTRKNNRLAMIGFLFPVIGVLLAIWAVRALIRWRKFGETWLVMDAVPGVLGGPLRGRVETRLFHIPQQGFEVILECVNRVTTGSGKNRSTSERLRSQQVQQIPAGAAMIGPTGVTVPIDFAVPYDAAETREHPADNQIIWRLRIEADVPGVDFGADFDVPIFKTADSRADYASTRPFDLDAVSIPLAAQLKAARIDLQNPVQGGVRLVLPMCRQIGSAIGLSCFWLLWTGFTVLLLHLDAPLLFPVVFGLFDLLIFAGMVDFWLARGWVEADRTGLRWRYGPLGLGRIRHIPVEDILAVRAESGMQSGRKLYYRIRVEQKSGRTRTLVSRVGGKALTERLAHHLTLELGLVK